MEAQNRREHSGGHNTHFDFDLHDFAVAGSEGFRKAFSFVESDADQFERRLLRFITCSGFRDFL
jgi:hypothetical protein